MSFRQKQYNKAKKKALQYKEYSKKLLVPKELFFSLFGLKKSKEYYDKKWIKLENNMVDWLFFVKNYYLKN